MAPASPPLRKIIHVDMDMFYAAVEMRDRPELRGKPLVVGGRPDSRSVATTASYEARKFGIHSGMSCAQARRLCPQCLFIPPDFKKYQQVSEQIHAIFREYTDLVESVSLDEAYLDVTRNKQNEPSATRLAREIKARIFAATGLTASAGVAANMFVAKIASDARKPDGLCVVRPEQVMDFIRPLPVIKIPGIGRVTDARLQQLGIRTVADLEKKPLDFLESEFGKFGRYLFDIARGIDERPVTPWRERQSYGAEETFPRDIPEKEAVAGILARVRRAGLHGTAGGRQACAHRDPEDQVCRLPDSSPGARLSTDFLASPADDFPGGQGSAGAHRGRPPAGPPGRHLAVQLRACAPEKRNGCGAVVQEK